MKKNNELYCHRCKHTWKHRNNKKPKVCPICKSKYWNSKKIADVLELIVG